jgi:uncharacterized integral membrane protein (TIGR00697 family)
MFKIFISLFSVIVVMSNIISAKFFQIPYFDLPLSAGILLYPASLILTDLVTELYGPAKARLMIWTAFGMSLLSLGILELTFLLPAAENDVFNQALSKNGWIVAASLTAYLAGQMIDVKLYAAIKRWTEGRFLWLRNTGSMLISQLVDTFIVNWIYLYIGLGFTIETTLQVILFCYIYKAAFSVINTPLYYYLVRKLKDQYELSSESKKMRSLHGENPSA